MAGAFGILGGTGYFRRPASGRCRALFEAQVARPPAGRPAAYARCPRSTIAFMPKVIAPSTRGSGAVGPQRVAHLGAADGGRRVDVGDRAARAGLDRPQSAPRPRRWRCAGSRRGPRRGPRCPPARCWAGSARCRPPRWPAAASFAFELGERGLARHQQREAVGELVEGLDAVRSSSGSTGAAARGRSAPCAAFCGRPGSDRKSLNHWAAMSPMS